MPSTSEGSPPVSPAGPLHSPFGEHSASPLIHTNWSVGALRKGYVTDRTAQAGPRDVVGAEEEVGQEKFTPNIRRVEAAVVRKPHRPHGITLFVLGEGAPRRRLAELGAARNRVIEPY